MNVLCVCNAFYRVCKFLSKITQIDSHIGYTLIFRLWSIVAGAVLMFVIPLFLSESEQGYYFTFSSLIAMQVFFELGFNFVIVQMVGHEMANLYIDKEGVISGNINGLIRVYSLILLLKKWYATISVLFCLSILIVGYCFFSNNGGLDLKNWLPSWSGLVLFSAINLFVSPFLAVYEGMGLVGQVAKLRLNQSIVGYLGFWFSLYEGWGLFGVPIIAASASVISCFWIYKKQKQLFPVSPGIGVQISWKKEIFPFQWKIALSWLSGYFIFQLFNPMLFSHQGSVVAGKIGLTLTVFNTMLSLSMSWISAKSPVMARLIAKNNRSELNNLFRSLVLKSGFLNIIIMSSFILCVWWFHYFDVQLVKRIADVDILIVLLFISVCNHFIFSAAAYMRAHKEEPMLWCSITVGVLTLPTIFFASKFSAFLTIMSYGAIVVFVSLPWTIYLFMKYKRRGEY